MSIRSDIRTILAAKGKPQRMTRKQRVSTIDLAMEAVEKYGKRNPVVRDMIRDKDRLRRFLETVAKIFGKKTMGKNAIDAAVRILLASGFTVRPGQTASRSGRGETAGSTPPATAPPPFSSTGPKGRTPTTPTSPAGTEEDPILAEVVGGGRAVDPQEASRTRQAAATVHLVDSSNVHSFYYVRDKTTGTLYVTFLAWAPGMKGSRKGNGPGPTYAYADVPVRKYINFKNMARSSAGSAVWTYLRVKGPGNQARHQHPYALTRVGPLGVRMLTDTGEQGAYVPRKITPAGYTTRNLPDLSGRSTLRPKMFKVPLNRAKATTVGDKRRYV